MRTQTARRSIAAAIVVGCSALALTVGANIGTASADENGRSTSPSEEQLKDRIEGCGLTAEEERIYLLVNGGGFDSLEEIAISLGITEEQLDDLYAPAEEKVNNCH